MAPPAAEKKGDVALAQRIVDLENKLEKMEQRLQTTSRTAIWLRYQVVELLKKAGLYVAREE
jgi:hypothetical protein